MQTEFATYLIKEFRKTHEENDFLNRWLLQWIEEMPAADLLDHANHWCRIECLKSHEC